MSYYFTILSPTDAPIFNIAFGTSKGGGDGIARFRFPDTAQYMNQFIIHSSLDIVEEAQWTNGGMSVLIPLAYNQYPLHWMLISQKIGTSNTSTPTHQPQPTSPPSSPPAAPASYSSTNPRNSPRPAVQAPSVHHRYWAHPGPRPVLHPAPSLRIQLHRRLRRLCANS